MSTKKIHQTSYDEKQKLWTGLKTRPLYNPEISLGDILLRSMEANGPKIAQVCFTVMNIRYSPENIIDLLLSSIDLSSKGQNSELQISEEFVRPN